MAAGKGGRCRAGLGAHVGHEGPPCPGRPPSALHWRAPVYARKPRRGFESHANHANVRNGCAKLFVALVSVRGCSEIHRNCSKCLSNMHRLHKENITSQVTCISLIASIGLVSSHDILNAYDMYHIHQRRLLHKRPTREREREREREKYYTFPALRLTQVLPGHPLADPKR